MDFIFIQWLHSESIFWMQLAQSFLYCHTASPGGPKRLWVILAWLQFNSDPWSLTQINSFSYKTFLLSFVLISRVIYTIAWAHTTFSQSHRVSVPCIVIYEIHLQQFPLHSPVSCQSLEMHCVSIFRPSFHPLLKSSQQHHNIVTIYVIFFPYYKSQLQLPALIPYLNELLPQVSFQLSEMPDKPPRQVEQHSMSVGDT